MEKCLFDSLYIRFGNNLKFKIEMLNGIQIQIISTIPWWRTYRYPQRENMSVRLDLSLNNQKLILTATIFQNYDIIKEKILLYPIL